MSLVNFLRRGVSLILALVSSTFSLSGTGGFAYVLSVSYSLAEESTCVINRFWSTKNSNEVLNKLKSKGFKASTLSTMISPHYISHHHIKDILNDLTEQTFS